MNTSQDAPLNRTENAIKNRDELQLDASCLPKQLALLKPFKSVVFYRFVWNRLSVLVKTVSRSELLMVLHSYISAVWVNFDPPQCITDTV